MNVIRFHENVAYSSPVDDLPNTIVNGWINSPGHRKNLESQSNVCAIAAYKSPIKDLWYFTQLLAYIN